jgi:hypothetical protein
MGDFMIHAKPFKPAKIAAFYIVMIAQILTHKGFRL